MNLIFPIVGLRHYLPEDTLPELIATLPDGAEVALVYDNANAHDRYAIQAWMALEADGERKKMQVGYVASDFAPMIRVNYPDAQLLYAHVVHPKTSDTYDTFFEVEMEVNKASVSIELGRIDLSPIAHIPLPMVQPEQMMAIREIMQYHEAYLNLSEEEKHDPDISEELIALARRSAPYLSCGLSGNERNAYVLLSTMLCDLHSYWPTNVMDLWIERMGLEDIHRDAFKTPELCAEVMDAEMRTLKASVSSFFDQYVAVLKAGLTTKEAELQAHQQWLKALPDNLYAYLSDRPQLASRLYYERFAMEELQAIYLHLLCVEWLREQDEECLPEFAEQAIARFSFWSHSTLLAKKREAVLSWRKAAMQDKEPVATVAMRTKQLQKAGVIVRPLRPFTKFVRELNNFLDTPVKENSLRKRFFPKHKDSYDEE